MNTIEDFSYGVIPVRKNKSNQYLFCIVQHHDKHWGFPKGHKEQGESDREAAIREVREETGINKINLIEGKIFSQRYSFEDRGVLYNKTVVYFLGFTSLINSTTEEDFKDEITEIRWLNKDDVLKLMVFPETKKFFEEVIEYLESLKK